MIIKKGLLTGLLTFLLIASLMLTSVLPVLAAAVAVSLSIYSGPPSTVITATGAGFTVGNTYTVYFSTTAVTSGTVPAGGTVTVAFGAPISPRGVYNVTITTPADTTAIPAPTFTITPQVFLNTTSGTIGDQVIVSGNGFYANTTVTIYFDNVNQTSVTSTSYGEISNAVVTIPQSYGGVHTITAGDTGGLSSGASYTITPKMSLSAATGAVGSSITVSGSGFAPNSQLSFLLDGNPISVNASTDTAGKINNVEVVIPSASYGTHVLTVQDGLNNSLTMSITVTAAITVAPTSGAADTNVSITGKGFIASSNIAISYDGVNVTTIPAALVSDASGTFAGNFKVPASASGTHIITVSDGTNSLTANFTTSASPATVGPTSGPVGTNVTASGVGFKPSTKLTIIYNGVQVASPTTDAKGNFSVTFAIPASSTGAHAMSISDGTAIQSYSFSVTPTSKMTPLSGVIGTDVTATGSGWGSSKPVTVKYDSDQIASSTTDANGTFNAVFKAPKSKGGNHLVTVSDGTTTATFTFAMDSTPPPVPTLILPPDTTRGDKVPTLSWSEVKDPSGVTYVLQFSKDATFGVLLWQKDGLTTTSYTFTEAETLKPASKKAPYYWRVKAIDGAANESEWSTPFNFFTGFVMPDWGWYLILGAVAVVLGIGGFFLGLMFGRRKAI